jgi:hypothetical protein
MEYNFFSKIVLLSAFFILSSCGGGSNSTTEIQTETDPLIPFSDVNSSDGFTSNYLDSKTFYSPYNYQGGNYITTYSFTDSIASWDFEHSNNGTQTAPYSIVITNGINGVLSYVNSYDLYYNIQSVELDHIKVCYNYYTGTETAIACDPAQAQKWYFDRATAESNYPNQ